MENLIVYQQKYKNIGKLHILVQETFAIHTFDTEQVRVTAN